MELTLSNGLKNFWQWDTGQSVTVPDNVPSVDFKINDETAVRVTVSNNTASVPDECFQSGEDLILWAYKTDHTIDAARVTVKPRVKPADYIYTPTETEMWHKLDARMRAMEANITNIEAWAEQAQTAAEAAQAAAATVKNKADKKTPSAAQNVALLDAGGNLMDSGKQLTPSGIGAMTDGAGLWGFTDLPSGADLNDYTACGFYKYSYDDSTFSIQNSPARAAFTMQVMNACGYGDHDAIGGKALKYRLQKLTTWQGDEYVRQAYTDSSGSVTYGAWKTILNNGALGITSGSWTPTVSGAASYTIQTGRYIKIGDMAVVTFSVYGTFAGSTTGRIKVSGCPLTPGDSITAGGGHLSGYTAESNIVFTGWNTNTNGSFYAVGQGTATTGSNKWGSEAIYQKASGEFSASGTIAFNVAG